MANKSGAEFQWQYIALLDDHSNACAHYRANERVAGGKRLWVTLLGFHTVPGTTMSDPTNLAPCPNPPTPITLTVHQAVEAPAGSGNGYTVAAHYAPTTSACKEQGGSDAQLDTGTVTFTTATDALLEGSFDSLVFSAGTVSGTFTCPTCVLCPPTPTRTTCVTG
jgi:hypothetical protein